MAEAEKPEAPEVPEGAAALVIGTADPHIQPMLRWLAGIGVVVIVTLTIAFSLIARSEQAVSDALDRPAIQAKVIGVLDAPQAQAKIIGALDAPAATAKIDARVTLQTATISKAVADERRERRVDSYLLRHVVTRIDPKGAEKAVQAAKAAALTDEQLEKDATP